MKAVYHLPGLFEFYELYKVFLPLFRSRKASAEFSVAVDVDPLDLL